ncbi:killer toxin [Glonium stellatum]|uniref:Killer toxin n=1 Tax=Glonium stellatum TaxID=574774 RepID=A0A8E2JYV3_9PEZI|nr:killer toxin [Glonium stellatum]
MHASFLTTLAVTALAVLSSANAKGINCEGSSDCGLSDAPSMGELVSIIEDSVPDDQFYANGEHIVCIESGSRAYSICAFCQMSGGAPGSSIKVLARELLAHGCQNCGSIPLFYPGDNNVADGELTFNAVR